MAVLFYTRVRFIMIRKSLMPNQQMSFIEKLIKNWPQILLREPSKNDPWYRHFRLYGLRLVYAMSRDLMNGDLSMRAMSLVYTTLITLVPLLALSFSVLKGFGVHNQMEPLLNNLFAPMGDQGAFISAKILDFVDNIKVGVLGVAGLGLLIYSVIALMQKIERSFNKIWNVSRSRSFAQRFSDYLSVLLIAPFFLFVSAGITATVRNFDVVSFLGIEAFSFMNDVIGFLSLFIPYFIMSLAFAFIYSFMPNTRVRLVPALVGGLFAAFMWKIMGFVFTQVIAGSASYVAIYAAFATLIIFMIWVYLAWFVVLLGASLSFYVQNPRYMIVGSRLEGLSMAMKEKIAMQILVYVGRDFTQKKQNWDLISLSKEMNVPIHMVNDLVCLLEESGLIAKTAEFEQNYVPGYPFETLTIKEALDKIRTVGKNQAYLGKTLKLDKPLEAVFKKVDKTEAKELNKPLSSLW